MATQRHYIQPSNGTHVAGDYAARVQMVDDDGNIVDFDTQTITTTNDSVDATGSTVPAKATFVAGSDGTNTVALKVDSDGNLQVEVLTLPALVTGSAAIGKLAANSGVDIGDVDVLSIAAGANAIGNVGVVPRTTGGLTTYHLVSAATTNATVVKASAGQLFGWALHNNAAAVRKIAFHNTASAPTAGASVAWTIVLPAGAAANVFLETGIAFSTGIAFTTVTEVTDAGTTAVAASDLNLNLFYA